MKRFKNILLFILISSAFLCRADNIDSKILTVTTGATSTDRVATTNTTIRGWIDTIDFDVVTANATGTLEFIVSPELSTISDSTLISTNDLATDISYRPRFDATDTSGNALTTDPPLPYALCGDSVIFAVTNASDSNLVFKAVIKYRRED
jgi:hypothetical protein